MCVDQATQPNKTTLPQAPEVPESRVPAQGVTVFRIINTLRSSSFGLEPLSPKNVHNLNDCEDYYQKYFDSRLSIYDEQFRARESTQDLVNHDDVLNVTKASVTLELFEFSRLNQPVKVDTSKNDLISKFGEYQFVFYNYARLIQIQKLKKIDECENEKLQLDEKHIKIDEWHLIIEVLWHGYDVNAPEKIVQFLRDSSHKIGRFYSRHRVIDTKFEKMRMRLVELLINLHDRAFLKLGVSAIDRM